jgi:chemotaxis protein methyltransferase CheR
MTPADSLSDHAYQLLVSLVYKHSRIRIGPDKQMMLANRLRKRVRMLGLDSLEDYAAFVASSHAGDELEELVDLLSTNHTHFYREGDHFTFLTQTALAQFLPDLKASGAPLRVWSAASSSGEEPYTLALVLAEYLQAHPGVGWKILASDISNRMLTRAKQAVYRMTSVAPVPAEQLQRYFLRGVDEWEGTCRVGPELRNRVQFDRINLFQGSYPISAPQHVIFCRNVMIYFDLESRAMAVERMIRHLVPGGYLIIGYSESLMGINHGLQQVQQGVFRLP